MRLYTGALLVALTTLAMGCNSHMIEAGPGNGYDPLGVIDLKLAPLNYQVLSTQILQPKCAKCHNPNDTSDASLTLFAPYSEIQNSRMWRAPGAKSKMVAVVTTPGRGRMPPASEGPGLNADEVDYITRYIDAGKPQ